MLRKTVIVVGAALLLGGCATTVPGTPVADPSGVPKPETGSYGTTPRTVAPMSDTQARAAEGFRMVETIPLPPDIDPAIRYGGRFTVGRPSLSSSFGDGVGTALAGMEVGAYVSAGSKKPGSSAKGNGTQLLMGFVRMKDEAAATAAVADPAILAADKPQFGEAGPAKETASIPGHSSAKAFTKNWTAIKTVATTAVMAKGRYVLVAYSTAGIPAIAKYFDKQVTALDTFTPTPVDKFDTLGKDRDVLRYTVASSGTRDSVLPSRAAVVNQTDITGSVKNFADAGVDLVARADNQVYRAKDADGAALLADRFLTEMSGFYPGTKTSTVKGVPGGRCQTRADYEGSKATTTYCVVPVGRYLSEVSGSQQNKVEQALGASYLLLREAK